MFAPTGVQGYPPELLGQPKQPAIIPSMSPAGQECVVFVTTPPRACDQAVLRFTKKPTPGTERTTWQTLSPSFSKVEIEQHPACAIVTLMKCYSSSAALKQRDGVLLQVRDIGNGRPLFRCFLCNPVLNNRNRFHPTD